MAAKFEIFLDRKKQYRFHLKASNGEIIAASEAYETKAACIKGIKAIQKNAPAAAIIDPEEAAKKAVKAAPAKRGAKAAAPAAKKRNPGPASPRRNSFLCRLARTTAILIHRNKVIVPVDHFFICFQRYS